MSLEFHVHNILSINHMPRELTFNRGHYNNVNCFHLLFKIKLVAKSPALVRINILTGIQRQKLCEISLWIKLGCFASALRDCLLGEFSVISGHCLHHSFLGNSHQSVSWATRCYRSLQGIMAFCAGLACKRRVSRLLLTSIHENGQDLGRARRKIPADQKQTR